MSPASSCASTAAWRYSYRQLRRADCAPPLPGPMTLRLDPGPGGLTGKVALVTGGSRGIGKAICVELASRGADIAFNYFRNHDAARAAEAEIAAKGVRCLRVRAHLAEAEAIPDLISKVVSDLGRLDVLVNNAASGVMRPAAELETKH